MGAFSSNFSSSSRSSDNPEGTTSVELKLNIGKHHSEVLFGNDFVGYEFYRTKDKGCTKDIAVCEQGIGDLIADAGVFIDETLNSSSHAFYHFQKNSFGTTFNSRGRFTPRNAFESIEFNGKLWVIGGRYRENDMTAYPIDIWSSVDGQTWVCEVKEAPFLGRVGFSLLLFKGKLWLIGGENDSVQFNDVWSSTNGVDWVEETVAADFPARIMSSVNVYNDKLWMVGGTYVTYPFFTPAHDIWSSVDGQNWFLEREDAEFLGYTGALLNSGDELIYLSDSNDIARSANGIDWDVDVSTIYPDEFSAFYFNGMHWLSGIEKGNNFQHAFWVSDNGAHWQPIRRDAMHSVAKVNPAVFNDEIYILSDDARYGFNEAWTTIDGSQWRSLDENGFAPPIREHQAISFNGKLWIFAGRGNGDQILKDVWSSDDAGFTWVKEESATDFGARVEHQVTVFNDKLWLIGGTGPTGTYNDVWSSEDGRHWHLETDNAAFTPRAGHQIVEFQGKLWLIGAGKFSTTFNDIWSSVDGIHWQLEKVQAEFDKRNDYRVTVFANKIWLIGGVRTDTVLGDSGFEQTTTYFADVWSSIDGINWVEEINAAPFKGRAAPELYVHNDKLWLSGGYNPSVFRPYRANDIWSYDGSVWVQENSSAAFTGRNGHQVITHNGELYLIGGEEGYGLNWVNNVWASKDGVSWFKRHRATIRLQSE